MQVVKFFVEGDPLAFPKKKSDKRSGQIRYDDPNGFKKAWMLKVRVMADRYMQENNKVMFGEDCPVTMKLVFYRERPPSVGKRDGMYYTVPYKKPDLDNFEYAIGNPFSGAIYYDDSRIVDMFIFKRWKCDNPEGKAGVAVYISTWNKDDKLEL